MSKERINAENILNLSEPPVLRSIVEGDGTAKMFGYRGQPGNDRVGGCIRCFLVHPGNADVPARTFNERIQPGTMIE